MLRQKPKPKKSLPLKKQKQNNLKKNKKKPKLKSKQKKKQNKILKTKNFLDWNHKTNKKKKETKQEVKSEPATPEERKQKAKEFDQALKDKKEEIKKDQAKKDANNREDNKGLLEGVKEFFGLTNLQKADRELKAILSVKANGLKEVQALLSSFETKYNLTKEEQAKLMDDNADAIKALIERDADKNFTPQMLLTNPKLVGATSEGLKYKKYTIITRFDVSTKAGPIQAGQSFTIKLDDRLTVKDPLTLKPIVNNEKTIAKPSYDQGTNSITYTIAEDITEDLQIPLAIDVDYNVEKIKKLDGDATTHSIKNSITGIGVTKAVSFPETVVDNDGKVVNQIIEPGSKDVLEIVDQGEDYQVHMDVSGSPIVKGGELASIDWTVRYSSTKDLLELGLISNATLVKGSGLSKCENITINGKPINKDDITANDIEGKLGIRESKNHKLKESTKNVVINFQTPVFNKQQKYMIDFSVLLKNRNKSGAVRLLFDKGYTDEQVKEKTSKRIGMNNRTTIMGEFTSENSVKWTVTDGVSTGDTNNGLPLATRDLTGAQDLTSSKMAVYGINENTGKMVIKKAETDLNKTILEKETNPNAAQAPGTIAVYEYDTKLTDSNAGYSMGGVNINKYQDLTIKQTWAGIDSTKKMPAQGFVVQDENGNAIFPEVRIPEGQTGKADREITIPSAKYWDIKTATDGSIQESKTNQKVVQDLPKDTTIGGTTYSYKEKYNYLAQEDGAYHIYNVMSQSTQEKDADFTVLKFDSEDPSKKLAGAKFTLQSPNETIELVTDANGRANFSNVSPGTYTLEESEAPEGYTKSNRKWRVTVYDTGNVLIRETGITGTGSVVEGATIKLPVTNKPVGEKFRVYKKNGNGQALQGAEFTIYEKDEKTVIATGTSDANGIVDFKFADGKSLEEGKQYILKETKAPQGYKPIDKKWVLEVKDGKTKVYNYVASTESTELKSFLAEDNVNWVDVKNRHTDGWSTYDNRWTGWTGNSQTAQYMGTRIIAINKTEKYAIQRYVINPEARKLAQTTASIHRQVPRDPYMIWYDGNAEYKVFELDKPVTGLISDLRLANYTLNDITDTVKATAKAEEGRYGESNRLNLTLPATSKPIVIDVKVQYINEDGGVGTGMDWMVDNSNIYWKADYYESVQDIIVGDPTKAAAGDIKGSYVAEGSLDVNNEKDKFQFKLKKVKDGTNEAIKGAVFKLTGPDDSPNERYMTTGTDSMITFAGLEAGTYKLEEAQPAPGYEKANTDWTVRITADGKVYIKDNKKQAGAETNAALSVVQAASSSSANRIRQYLAQNSASLNGVNTGLEFGQIW